LQGFDARLIDELHRTFVQIVRYKHVIFGMHKNVDDRVADPKHVVSCGGHVYSDVGGDGVLFAPWL
jgi:hypothetical protein